MISNVIVILCTALMVGALIWVVINENKATKDTEEKEDENGNDK